MKVLKIAQTLAAGGLIVAGVLLGTKAYAGGGLAAWNTSVTGAIGGRADFTSGRMDYSDAYITANVHFMWTTSEWAEVQGLDYAGNPISGCYAADHVDDGATVGDISGCQAGRSYYWSTND